MTPLYEVLEVTPRASNFVIRAAYQSLMQHHHPGKNPVVEGARQRVAGINDAYTVLSDAAKRLAYDRKLALIEKTQTFWRGTRQKSCAGEGQTPNLQTFWVQAI